jgi:DNA mismatch repair protein MutL
VLAQAGEKYLVVECPDGIKLVDQHALHERWNYERLKDREHPVNSQKMILPIVVEMSPAEASLFDQALPVLRDLGFEAESFGASTLSISAAPEIVRPAKVEQVIRDVFADLEDAGKVVENVRDKMLESLACRSAVLFGTGLPQEALVAIMDKFYEARQPLTCPHGRPTTVTITWEELERRFGRS